MWLNGQQKRQVEHSEGQTGTVTVGGLFPAVQLDCERREVEVFSPAGYHWTPQADQRVVVIQNRDENPCIVGAQQTEQWPRQVDIGAGRLELHGQIYINGVPLDRYIRTVMGG